MRFHLIDRIVGYRKWMKATGVKNITVNDELMDTFIEKSVFPNTLLCESVLQTIAWLVVKSSDKKKRPVVLSIGSLKFLSEITYGNQVKTEVVIEEIQDDTIVCNGKAFSGDTAILELSNCFISLLDTSSLETPEETEAMINLLYREE